MKFKYGFILIAVAAFVGGLALSVRATPDNPVEAAFSTYRDYTAFPNGVVAYPLLNTVRVVDYITTTAARSVLAYESGTVFTMSSTADDPTTFSLPAAEAGLTFTFVDLDATAAADLVIDPATGDKINGGTAGVSYNCTGDAVGQTTTITAVDDTNWVVVGYLGTWAAGS